ncbi:MAG: hypothetical protein QXM75_02715 [Candidatus Diapherotrites archaeon]
MPSPFLHEDEQQAIFSELESYLEEKPEKPKIEHVEEKQKKEEKVAIEKVKMELQKALESSSITEKIEDGSETLEENKIASTKPSEASHSKFSIDEKIANIKRDLGLLK